MSSENVGLLCSRSLSQPRLKVSVNVSLDDILCIICEKWVSIFKVKVTLTEFRFIQSNMTVSVICFELLIFGSDQLSLTMHVHKLECLVKRLLCCIQGQGHSEGSVNVCPDNISDRSNLVW